MFTITTKKDDCLNVRLSLNVHRMLYNPEVTNMDEVKRFALMGAMIQGSKSAVAEYLKEKRLYTVDEVREDAIVSGLFPYNWPAILTLSAKMGKDKAIKQYEQDGVSFVSFKDSTVPLVILQGLFNACTTLKMRKSRNKKALTATLAKRYWILDEVAKNPIEDAEQYKDIYFGLFEVLENLQMDYRRYNPEVVNDRKHAEEQKKHEDYFLSMDYFDYDSAWESACSKAKQHTVRTSIATEQDEKSPLEQALALLDNIPDLELRLKLKELLAQV